MVKIIQFLALLFISVSAAAQTSVKTNEEQIKDLIINSFQEILSENKKEKIPEYYTEDFLLLEVGEVWDLEIIRNYMDKAAQMDQLPERINSFDFIKVEISGDMAWTAYHNKAVFKVDGQVVGEMNWLESATAVLTEDGWKLQMLHSTLKEEE